MYPCPSWCCFKRVGERSSSGCVMDHTMAYIQDVIPRTGSCTIPSVMVCTNGSENSWGNGDNVHTVFCLMFPPCPIHLFTQFVICFFKNSFLCENRRSGGFEIGEGLGFRVEKGSSDEHHRDCTHHPPNITVISHVSNLTLPLSIPHFIWNTCRCTDNEYPRRTNSIFIVYPPDVFTTTDMKTIGSDRSLYNLLYCHWMIFFLTVFFKSPYEKDDGISTKEFPKK